VCAVTSTGLETGGLADGTPIENWKERPPRPYLGSFWPRALPSRISFFNGVDGLDGLMLSSYATPQRFSLSFDWILAEISHPAAGRLAGPTTAESSTVTVELDPTTT